MWTLRPSLHPRFCNSSRNATGAVSKFPTTPMLRILLGCCASGASGAVSRLRMSVTMHPTVRHHMVVSSRQPHADLLLSVEAELSIRRHTASNPKD
jgi:hypothetical protein